MLHAGRQLVEAEGFADMVVGPEGKGSYGRGLVGAGGDHEDRQKSVPLPKNPAEIEAFSVRKPENDKDEVEGAVRHRLPGLGDGVGQDDRKAPVGKGEREGLTDQWIVFDKKDLLHGRLRGRSGGRGHAGAISSIS